MVNTSIETYVKNQTNILFLPLKKRCFCKNKIKYSFIVTAAACTRVNSYLDKQFDICSIVSTFKTIFFRGQKYNECIKYGCFKVLITYQINYLCNTCNTAQYKI